MKYLFHTLVISIVFLLPMDTAVAAKCLRLAVSDGAAVLEKSSQTFSKILSANSICHSLYRIPSKRLHDHFLKGEVDGDLGRVHFYKKNVGDRGVMVETPILSIDGLLVTKNRAINSIDDVNKSIGILRGRVWMHEIIDTMKHTESIEVTRVNSMDTLSKLLELDRVEAILITNQQLRNYSEPTHYKIIKVMNLNVHVWLTPANKDLSPIFNSLIKQHLEKGKLFIN